MADPAGSSQRRRARLAEEVAEQGFAAVDPDAWPPVLLDELDYALHPAVHERRVPSYGAVVAPTVAPEAWAEPTGLAVTCRRVDPATPTAVRRFADGLSSFAVRQGGAPATLVVFDRPAGSERDLVVLAQATGGALVQRHPSGVVRLVDAGGVLRWDGIGWHHEPPLASWLDLAADGLADPRRGVLRELLDFAVHDLGSRNVGATLVLHPSGEVGPGVEERLALPPRLEVRRPSDLAPLRHVLGQIDGAAVFDGDGVLRHLGVRLVPTPGAEAGVAPYRGMRHTAARRHSFDEPDAVVVVVSEDGPVTVLRAGQIVGRTHPDGDGGVDGAAVPVGR